MKMKIINQITIIKAAYILLLAVVILVSLEDASTGFMDGWQGVTNEKSNNNFNPNAFLELLSGILMLVSAYLGSRIIAMLYAFINSAKSDDVFNVKNYSRLLWMGINSIITSFLVYFYNLIKFYVKHDALKIDTLRNVDFNFWLFVFGLTLLTIALVFKKGIELKQENDLTI